MLVNACKCLCTQLPTFAVTRCMQVSKFCIGCMERVPARLLVCVSHGKHAAVIANTDVVHAINRDHPFAHELCEPCDVVDFKRTQAQLLFTLLTGCVFVSLIRIAPLANLMINGRAHCTNFVCPVRTCSWGLDAALSHWKRVFITSRRSVTKAHISRSI